MPADHVADRERIIHLTVDRRVLWTIVATQHLWDAGTSRLYGYAINIANNTAYLGFQVPADFVGFPVNSIRIKTYKTNVAATGTISLLQGGAVDAGINAAPITPVGVGAWEELQFTPMGVYAAGDWFGIQIDLAAPGAGVEIRFAEIEILYTSAY